MIAGKYLYIIILAAILVIAAFYFSLNKLQIQPQPSNQNQREPFYESQPQQQNIETSNQTTESKKYIVEIFSTGFSPRTLRIKVGDSVTWINRDSSPHWPASDLHPTHTLYPGSGIHKCGTPEQSEIFDACRGLAQGESFTFTFKYKGTWNYHDHLNPSLIGTIIVE